MSMALDSLGISAYDSLANDKVWQQYQMAQLAAMGSQKNDSTGVTSITTPSGNNNLALKGASQGVIPRATEAQKSNNTLAALSAIGIGVAGLAYWGYRRGNGKATGFFKQIGAGLKDIFTFKKGNKQIFQWGEINGKKVCKVPNYHNKIYGADAAKHLDDIGVKNGTTFGIDDIIHKNSSGVIDGLADGVQLRKGTFKLSTGEDVAFKYTQKNGEKVLDIKVTKGGKDLTKYYLDPDSGSMKTLNKARKTEIDNFMKELNGGNKFEEVSGLEIVHQDGNLFRKFSRKNPSDNFEFNYAISDNFNPEHQVVQAHRVRSSEADEALKLWEKGKPVGKIAEAERKTSFGTFIIKNNEIVGIRNSKGDMIKPGSIEYQSLEYKHKKIFDNILKDDKHYTNVFYSFA